MPILCFMAIGGKCKSKLREGVFDVEIGGRFGFIVYIFCDYIQGAEVLS